MHTRRTYNPILGWQLILAFTLSGLGAYWTFVVARHFQFSLVPALVVSVTSFFMALTQIKYLVGHVLVLVDQNARRALFHEPVVTSVYRNRSIHPGVEPTES